MSRTKNRAGRDLAASAASAILLVATALMAGIPEAQGQGTVPDAQRVNPSSSPSSPAQATTGGQTGAPDQAAASTAAQSPSGSGKPAPVCFKLTGRCVEGAKSAAAGKAGTAKDRSAAQRPLNLTAPDVRTVVSADELKEPLPSGDQITEVQEAETVSVKAEPNAPDVPGGFGAIWWALNHPSQAWRILAPAE